MIFTEHVTNDTGTLPMRAVMSQAEALHGIENTPVDRLQAIPYIGQGPGNDNAHRVVEIRTSYLVFNIDWPYFT